MKFLAIDTSGGAVCVAAKNGDREAVRGVEGTTSVYLMGEIENVLKDVSLSVNDVDFIACVVGPGSFTGIRIGISTAKGLCFALGKRALAVTAFDLTAYIEEDRMLSLVDAGHGNYYACPFEKGVRGTPTFLSADEVAEYGARGYVFVSTKPLAFDSVIADGRRGLLEAAKCGAFQAEEAEGLAAMYLRKSSAEEKR